MYFKISFTIVLLHILYIIPYLDNRLIHLIIPSLLTIDKLSDLNIIL